jgi:hypothetical protein
LSYALCFLLAEFRPALSDFRQQGIRENMDENAAVNPSIITMAAPVGQNIQRDRAHQPR